MGFIAQPVHSGNHKTPLPFLLNGRRVPRFPYGFSLLRAICFPASECPTSQTWLEKSRAWPGPWEEAIPYLLLAAAKLQPLLS